VCGGAGVKLDENGLLVCWEGHSNGGMNNDCGKRNQCGKSEGSYECNDLPLNTYACGSPNNRWSLNCGGSPINRWATACGRNEGEIVKAVIDF